MVFRRAFIFFLITGSLLWAGHTKATHIVGGELYYEHLGNNAYKFTLVIYRDCINGIPLFDNPANIGVYDSSNTLVHTVKIFWNQLVIDTVPLSISDSCTEWSGLLCYERGVFTTIDTLPYTPGGFTLAYDRCCWNETVSNLVSPDSNGIAILSFIPDTSLVADNSSPVFNQLTPPFVCLDREFIFDHSATDADGDSLSYELFTPWNSTDQGANGGTPGPPPFFSLINKPPNLPISIDPITGILTSTPEQIGQYVFGVRVNEYRNGALIGESSRSYQLNVVACNKVTVANFNRSVVQCGDSLVFFSNVSTGASSYLWNFKDPQSADTTSTNKDPSHLFSGLGIYTVRLIAYSDLLARCNDTAYGQVSLYPELISDFSFEDEICENLVHFFDETPSAAGKVVKWNWSFGDGGASNEENPDHIYNLGNDPKTYIVKLIVENEHGCTDSITKSYTGVNRVYSIDALEISKSFIYPREDSVLLTVIASNAVSYEWSPQKGLSHPFASSTWAKPDKPTAYTVTVTDNRGCKASSNVEVIVYEYSCGEEDVYVPNAFSPNGDGENDYLRVRGEELTEINFSIFNRWGKAVFESTDLGMLSNQSRGWDGTYKGKKQDPGVFVYYLKARCSDNREFILKGNITLLR
ncbi:MAG: PKD domain-containing protein [Vicingaceae bacterium]